ncbi:MAG: flagellin [Alphaproteobacteria bacterium]|nr:MAG: flagellin [Alphaproteobacteria bacterium]
MSSDVVLTAALRNNLLSLQSTQNLIDTTQLRLATGLKVNSALDSPSNFFAAQSLDNRASDLTRLLDGVGQSIRTIEAADNGITALTNLVEQAQSITSSARDELAASEGEARVTGTVDLSDVSDLTTIGLQATEILRITTTDDSGNQITENITIGSGSAEGLAATITNNFADNRAGEITASLNDEGFLSIESSDGRSFTITTDPTTGGTTDIQAAGFAGLGLGDIVEVIDNGTGAGTAVASATVIAGNTLASISIFEGTGGNVAEAGDAVNGSFVDNDGNTIITGVDDTIDISVNNGTAVSFDASTGGTFQDLVDTINQDTSVNELIEANFDSATGQLSIISLSDDVDNVQLRVTGTAGSTFNIGLGDTSGNLNPLTTTGANTVDQTFTFNSSTAGLDSLANDYNNIRTQIDSLVSDASYRGVNLLNGDDLTTFFNENNSSQLTTEGATFTANGLGLNEASFRSSAAIELTSTQSREALSSVRSFGSSLANNLSIIQTREDFTKSTINTLKAGADDLTVADQNEEGANLLALQTRQTLGVTSLSLASQSQQAVLRLF